MAPATLTILEAGRPLRRGELAIIPVERSRVRVSCDRRRLFAEARKELEAIVIVSPGGARALDASGRSIDLADLVARASGLREALPA